MKRTIGFLVAMVVAGQAWAAPYVILKQGKQRYEGVSLRAKFDRSIVLKRADGTEMTFTADQVEMAVADKPATYDATVAAVQGGKYDAAIPALKQIITDYRCLTWDLYATAALSSAYIAKKDPDSAVRAYEDIFKLYPQAETTGDSMWRYTDALVAAKQFAKVEPKLDKAIKEGAKPEAARALVTRGDIRRGENKLELAVRDYLRTVWFFERERDVMPRALLRAGQVLEQLRDPRAKQMYSRLVQEYPDSPEAQEAKGKI